jgi:hypothetical protein
MKLSKPTASNAGWASRFTFAHNLRATAVFLACSVFLIGCFKTDDPFPGFKKASGDVVPFVMDQALALGAHPVSTNSLPKIEAEWRFKRDADGVQLYLVGDCFPEVQSFLLAAFGPPAISARTNEDGHITGGVYAAPTTGAAIQFGREDAGGRRYTQIVIVRKEAFKP